jgi:lysine 2,3-aminomutase
VLLRGVNDDIGTMRDLMSGLLGIRVRPYYLHQMDLVKGTAHFRTPLASGLEIIKALRGHISGLAVPHYVIDLAGGKGKVPILPDTLERDGDQVFVTTYRGERVAYRDILPIPNQGAICVGSSSAPQRTKLYAFVASILAALISSLI